MDDKQKFDALMALADFERRERIDRTQTELRVSLGVWALLAAAIIYVKIRPAEPLVIGALLAVVVGYAIGVGRLNFYNWIATGATSYYLRQARNVQQGRPDMEKVFPMTKIRDLTLANRIKISFWPIPLRLLATALLACAAYFLIGSSNCSAVSVP